MNPKVSKLCLWKPIEYEECNYEMCIYECSYEINMTVQKSPCHIGLKSVSNNDNIITKYRKNNSKKHFRIKLN